MISNRLRIAAELVALISNHQKQMTSELSTALGLSASYIEQICRELRAGGIITGQRGPGGGYKMARDPSQVTVQDVALCMPAGNHDSALDRAIAGFLSTLTIADMAQGAA